jgi:FMN phosphatase YigB (HAD superfamily)
VRRQHPSVLLLDVDGVLQFPRPAFAAAMATEYPWRDGYAAFEADLFADPVYVDCLTGDRDFLDVADRVLARHVTGLSAERFLDRWLRENIELNQELLGRVPDWGFDLVFLATNQEPLRGSYLERIYAAYPWCTGVFLSCRIGARKPDPRFFGHILRDLRQPPGECLLVDADEPTVEAARSLGLAGLHYTDNEQLAAAIDGR